MKLGGPAFFLGVGLIILVALPDATIAGVQLSTVGMIITVISGVVLLLSIVLAFSGLRTKREVRHDPDTGYKVEETRHGM